MQGEVLRQSWDDYFITLAHVVADRGTCDRAKIGCVVTKNNRILATGYNGSMPGEDHCDDVGHFIEDGHCIRTIHAEINAIAQAARHGQSIDGSVVYLTHFPCFSCYKALVAAGVMLIICYRKYREPTYTDMPVAIVCLDEYL